MNTLQRVYLDMNDMNPLGYRKVKTVFIRKVNMSSFILRLWKQLGILKRENVGYTEK